MLRIAGLVVMLLLIGFPFDLVAQRRSGTITTQVPESIVSSETIESGEVEAYLYDGRTDGVVQHVPVTTSRSVEFRDVLPGSYRLEVVRADTTIAIAWTHVVSTLPTEVSLVSIDELSDPPIVVTASRFGDRESTETSTVFTASLIESMPVVDPAKKIEAVLSHTPGVVPDEDGRFHVRGEDAQLQYVIDGIPVTANMTRIYGTLFDAGLINSVRVETGGLDPEYGVATAGVLDINTKSGFDDPSFLQGNVSWGSYNTMGAGLIGGGSVSRNLSGVLALSVGTSDRYLDPISGFDPIHDHGTNLHLFARGDWKVASSIDLSALAIVGRTSFEIPNGSPDNPGQDQRQELRDHLVGIRMKALTGSSSLLSLVAYERFGSAEITSGGLLRIRSRADREKALVENEKFFIGGVRENRAYGAGADYSVQLDWPAPGSYLKGGVSAEVFPLDEFFTFAVTDSALSSRNRIGGDARLAPYDLTRDGSPFVVDRSETGFRASAYLQERISWGKARLVVGGRFDRVDLLEEENHFSPRISASYALGSMTTLRGSYNRIIMQAPVENILVSSSPSAVQLSGSEQVGTPVNVTSEKAHVVELGVTHIVDPHLSFGFATYGKSIDDFIVKAELGSSGVIFPINLKKGLVIGGELGMALREWNNLTVNLILSGGIAYGLIPEDGSSPIAAGLIIGEEGHNYAHPFDEEDHFPTEHSQLLSSSLQIAYDHPSGIFALVDGRFDSGLPFDLTDASGRGPGPEASRAELRSRGYSDDVIDLLSLESERPGSPDKSVAPHVTLDVSAGIRLFKGRNRNLTLTGTVSNIFDTPYLYKFESSFGGTHFGRPRMFAVSASFGL